MKADPIQFLLAGKSVYADCARKRWGKGLKKSPTAPGQNANGSWGNSLLGTITSLYHLSLFTDKPDKKIKKALDWLLEEGHESMVYKCNDGASYSDLFFKGGGSDKSDAKKIKGLPFTSGCMGFVKTGATLYLVRHFGYSHNKADRAFESIARIPAVRKGAFCSGSCGNNLFQALVLHPKYSKGRTAGLVLDYLKRHQNADGTWRAGIPFYQTFNALSRLNHPKANSMFRKAYTRLLVSQNKDGSWGRSNRDFQTYMVVDALTRKNVKF